MAKRRHWLLPQLPMSLLYTVASAAIVITGTLVAIQYAKGNFRLTKNQGFARETGLLSANSFPTGAQVLIDGKLVTATDDTLYLQPGEYQIELRKDGYSPWKKTLSVQRELVTQTNALLFPSAPSFSPLTFTGAQNISPSPDGQKLIFYTASASSELQNGLYVLEMSGSILPLQREPKQIAEDTTSLDLKTAQFIWSPDSNEVMLVSHGRHVMLGIDKKQNISALPDVGLRARDILSAWEEEMYLRERQFLGEFPPEVIQIATQSARNVYFSPDKKRLLYTATTTAALPDNLIPAVPAASTQAQERNLQPNGIYIYDRSEDRNFRVGTEGETEDIALKAGGTLDGILSETLATPSATLYPTKQLLATDLYSRQPTITLEASPSAFTRLQATTSAQSAENFRTYHTPLYSNTLQWFPDSKHLFFTPDYKVRIKSYDNANETTLYDGPFADLFVYPWPDGSRLLILTTFSPNTPANLYAIELKK